MPKSNVQFWMEKWSKNVKRDKRNEKAWKDGRWNVITVWGCALEGLKRERTLLRICECLNVWAEEAALGKKRRTPHRLTLPRMP
jgi:DNA mismatch endonuclease (patch repair protein)